MEKIESPLKSLAEIQEVKVETTLVSTKTKQPTKNTLTIKKEVSKTEVTESILDSNEEKELYTTSADGKYKISLPRSEYDSDRLEENKFNIPQLKIPGYVIAWPHDVKANSIPNMVAKGWQFISPLEPGCEAVSRKIPAGRTAEGATAYHYAMKMPESKHKEMIERDEKERRKIEDAIKNSPSNESKAIYATEEMDLKRHFVTRSSSNMS